MPAHIQTFEPAKIIEQMMGNFQNNGNIPWWNFIENFKITYFEELFDAGLTGLFFKSLNDGSIIYKLFINNEAYKNNEKLNLAQNIKQNTNLRPIYIEEKENTYCYINDNSILLLVCDKKRIDKFTVFFASNDIELYNKVKPICEGYIDKDQNDPNLFVVIENGDGGLKTTSLGKPKSDLIKENYNQSVIDDYNYTCEQLSKDDLFGRLVILHGPPGTGKTYLLRSFFSNLDSSKFKFLYLQSDFFAKFPEHQIVKLLLKETSDMESLVLIVEDADECLAPRQSDNISSISKLLNLADGFLGNMLDLRIIVTTNVPKIEIDNALKRPGRLCKIINVDKLNKEQANIAYEKLSGEVGNFANSVTLAEVYEKVNNTSTNIVNDSTIGFK